MRTSLRSAEERSTKSTPGVPRRCLRPPCGFSLGRPGPTGNPDGPADRQVWSEEENAGC